MYRLVVLTHGDHGDTLRATLESFHEHVTPKPSEYVCIRDGYGALPPINPDGQTWRGVVLMPQQGFCAATRAAWRAASLPGVEYVFWLEHDFRFLRPVDVNAMVRVLGTSPALAQVSLLRGPENRAERHAGSVLGPLRRKGREFHARELLAPDGDYIEHDAYFTTNPSLMRRAFMADNPWPSNPDECEGHFGLSLIADGYRFAIMGDGEPWVEHTGERDGFGY